MNNHLSNDNHSNNVQQSINNNDYSEIIDDDTKYLMMLHQQIIPTPNLVRNLFKLIFLVLKTKIYSYKIIMKGISFFCLVLNLYR